MTEPSSQPQPVSTKPCLISLRPEEIRAREGFYRAAAGKQFLDLCLVVLELDTGWVSYVCSGTYLVGQSLVTTFRWAKLLDTL